MTREERAASEAKDRVGIIRDSTPLRSSFLTSSPSPFPPLPRILPPLLGGCSTTTIFCFLSSLCAALNFLASAMPTGFCDVRSKHRVRIMVNNDNRSLERTRIIWKLALASSHLSSPLIPPSSPLCSTAFAFLAKPPPPLPEGHLLSESLLILLPALGEVEPLVRCNLPGIILEVLVIDPGRLGGVSVAA